MVSGRLGHQEDNSFRSTSGNLKISYQDAGLGDTNDGAKSGELQSARYEKFVEHDMITLNIV